MKQTVILGDSIFKGVLLAADENRYYVSREIDWAAIGREFGADIRNLSKMGCRTTHAPEILKKYLEKNDRPEVIVIELGGNDCDYDWKAISEDPDGEHLPHTPSEQFIDQYCTAIRKAQSAGARVAMTSLPPLEQERYFSFITRGLSAENILHWLGDTDHLYRWQEYYNAMVAQLSRAFGCRLVDLRAEFLKSRVFPTLIGADGIHPTQAGHDLIHHTVQSALAY